jgi:hypothetical protein
MRHPDGCQQNSTPYPYTHQLRPFFGSNCTAESFCQQLEAKAGTRCGIGGRGEIRLGRDQSGGLFFLGARSGAQEHAGTAAFKNELHISLNFSISWFVRRLKTALTLLLLANWFVCTAHCQSEQTGHFRNKTENSAAGLQTFFSVPHDCPSNSQVCDWIASGGFQLRDNRIAAPEFLALPLAVFLQVSLSDLTERFGSGVYNESTTVPPELFSSILFVLRTALPARAPSLAS